MIPINRLMINICSDFLEESRDFYTYLFDFNINYDSDWFVHLISKDKKLEFSIIDKSNDLIPMDFRMNPQGFYITFVVDDVDVIFDIAQKENFEIVKNPENTFYGQRRFLLKDPNGALLDISSPIKNFKF